MPGIIGVIPLSLDNELLEHMISSIRHEEWYRIDKYFDPFFGIARVHLGIFNPEPQPIFNEDKSLCIFMDGKIYDYDEEVSELKTKGYKFNMANDPEFCLHLYEELGEDFVKKLNGDFVIAICDLKEGKLLLANDRSGLRPHYYAMSSNNKKLLFSPEIKAILQDKTFKKELNDEAIAEFFAFGEFWDEKTLFKGVSILPPASIFIYDGKKISIEQYWHFSYSPDYNLSEEDTVEQLIEALKKSVKIRMKDNLRYGVALSGGLDSRSVVAAIDPEKRKDVPTYTFGPKDCDEVKIAKEVAQKAGTKHLSIDISPELLIDNAKQEVWLSDGRVYMGVSFDCPISKLVKDKIDVVFDGFELGETLGGNWLNESRVYCKNEDLLFNELFEYRVFQEEEFRKLFTQSYYHNLNSNACATYTLSYISLNSVLMRYLH
jgi:asparagine synthase (glutamine-hydrolysing)